MIFPFEIKYSKKLVGEIESFSTHEILESYRKDFEKSCADSVRFIENGLIAENRLFEINFKPGLNWNRWGGVSKARLLVIENNNKRTAIYTFNLTRIFVVGAIAGVFFGLISKFYLVGIFAFVVLGIFNWVAKLIQHRITFVSVIDNLIYERKRNLSSK
jgi:hypothetical protein